jgi:hypothetical protein
VAVERFGYPRVQDALLALVEIDAVGLFRPAAPASRPGLPWLTSCTRL